MCHILTLSKQDLLKVDGEFAEMVGELFINSYHKIKKLKRLSRENESQFLARRANLEVNGQTELLELLDKKDLSA